MPPHRKASAGSWVFHRRENTEAFGLQQIVTRVRSRYFCIVKSCLAEVRSGVGTQIGSVVALSWAANYKAMGGGPRSDGGAPPISADVRKTIQTIREITGNHSDEEIYALLKESNMNPDETAQKLLSQDTFHEVKRKRDKKKESVIRDSGDLRSKSGNQGRVGRTGAFLDQGRGRGSYLPHYNSYDAGAGRGFRMARNNRIYRSTNRGSNSAVPPSTALQNEPIVAYASERSSLRAPVSSIHVLPNGSSAYVRSSQASKGSWRAITVHTTMPNTNSTNPAQLHTQIQSVTSSSSSAMLQGEPVPNSQQYITLTPANSVSGVYSSSSDPVLVPSLEPRVTGVVGAIKRVVGTVGARRSLPEHSALSHSVESRSFPGNLSEALELTQSNTQDASVSTLKLSGNDKSASGIIHSGSHNRAVCQSVRLHGDHVSESRPQASTSSVSRSSFMGNHYNSRSQQQPVGHQKAAGPNMEWKPKPTNQNSAVTPGVLATSALSIRASEVTMSPPLPSSSANLEIATTRLHEKLEELNIRDDRHVIIPNHLQVSEADRTSLSFGSFGAGFGTNFSSSFGNNDSDKSCTPQSEASEESNEEPPSSISNTAPFAPNEDYLHHQETSTSAIENLSSSNDVTGSIAPTASSQAEALKLEPVVKSSSQYSLVQTAPNYTSIGLVPQIIQSQYSSYEPAESQQQDVSRLPSFVHTYDPSTSYYSPIFRPGSDGDARFHALIGSSAASNYNGIVTLLSGRSASLSQETGNSVVLSTAGATAQVTQTAGTPQITLPLQQPLPMFAQPPGVHISHLPPNYLPYPQYLSPLYVPPPTIHGFASNPGYPQLPTGSNYPLPAASLYPPAAAALKYSISQYKPGIASGNAPHRGVPAGYGSYTTAPGYAVSPAVSGGSVSGFDDIVVPQYKEHNLYTPSQQLEGSAFWVQAPPRDPSGMQSSSYYNPQAQGQHATYAPSQSGHVPYAPSQSGHAPYAGLYHPTQSGLTANVHHLLQQSQTLGGAVGVANAQAGAYQQSQHGQLNWTNNY